MSCAAAGRSLLIGLVLAAPRVVHAQTTVVCELGEKRAGRALGCYITGHLTITSLPRDTALYWLLDTFPTPAAAAAARSARALVVQSLGSTWLFTIAPRDWSAGSGHRVAAIGPLPLVEADSFMLLALESTLAPGMGTAVHRHPGTEAFLTLEGEMCVEMPSGVQRQKEGDRGIVLPPGTPMVLTSTGTTSRRSLAILLHDAAQARSSPVPEWSPRGLCARPPAAR